MVLTAIVMYRLQGVAPPMVPPVPVFLGSTSLLLQVPQTQNRETQFPKTKLTKAESAKDKFVKAKIAKAKCVEANMSKGKVAEATNAKAGFTNA